jgi:hypothetical protein
MACLSRKSTAKSNVTAAKVKKKSGRHKASSATSSNKKKRNTYVKSTIMGKNFYPSDQFPRRDRADRRRTIYEGAFSESFPPDSIHQNRTLVHSRSADDRLYARPKLFKPHLSLPTITENPDYFRQIARSPIRQEMSSGSIFDMANFYHYQQQQRQQHQQQRGVNRNPLHYQQYTPQINKFEAASHGMSQLFLSSGGGSHHYVNERNFTPTANDLLFYGEETFRSTPQLPHLVTHADRHRRKSRVSASSLSFIGIDTLSINRL